MAESNVTLNPADLAPGDVERSGALDVTPLEFHKIESTLDPLFRVAYNHLYREFGERHELELEEVLAARLANREPNMRYEMILVQKSGVFAAVRDHTAMATPHGTVVHLSHLLVDARHRRTGLAGWMRALPITAAHAIAPDAPVTLAAEMEYPSASDETRMIRLRAYERAGFVKIDPARVPYLQPDFRSAAEIDAGGGPRLLAMSLLIRRVGRESERTISAAEARHIVLCLYRMYARTSRPADMAPCFAFVDLLEGDDRPVALIEPTTPLPLLGISA